MTKRIALFVAMLFTAATVWACPGDKVKDDGRGKDMKKPVTLVIHVD